MKRDKLFTMHVNEAERQMIDQVAREMNRSAGDALRQLVRERIELIEAQKQQKAN